MIQNTLCVTQNILLAKQMTQNTLFYGLCGDGYKNHNKRARGTWSLKWENIKWNVEPCLYWAVVPHLWRIVESVAGLNKISKASISCQLCSLFKLQLLVLPLTTQGLGRGNLSWVHWRPFSFVHQTFGAFLLPLPTNFLVSPVHFTTPPLIEHPLTVQNFEFFLLFTKRVYSLGD